MAAHDRLLPRGEADRIDAERAGRELIDRCSQLPALERAAVELVDLDGLTPKERDRSGVRTR